MVDAADIHNRGTLSTWMDKRPYEDVLWIAVRATARTLPVWWEFSNSRQKSQYSASKFFRAVLVSNERLKTNSKSLASKAFSASVAMKTERDKLPENSAPYCAADAAATLAFSAARGVKGAFNPEFAASEAVFSASKAIVTEADVFWELVRKDARNCETGSKDYRPLWGNKVSHPFRLSWGEFKRSIPQSSDTIPDYSVFWLPWFEDLIEGRRTQYPEPLLQAICNIEDDEWRRGDLHINNTVIPNLIYSHGLAPTIANTPIGAEVAPTDDGVQLTLKPTDNVEPDYLENVIGLVASARRLFDEKDTGFNAYTSLHKEFRILDDALSLHAKRPVMLLSDVTRVLSRLSSKVERQECPGPEVDDDIRDFRDTLAGAQADLIALSPEVRAYFEARKPDATDEDTAKIVEALDKAKRASDAVLEAELVEASNVLADPNASPEEKRNAFFMAAGLVSRMYKVARGALKETAEVTTNIAIVGGTAAGAYVYLASNPTVQKAIDIFIRYIVGGGS